VDLVVARAPEHASEEHHVGQEREHVEADRDDEPVPGRVVELAERLVGAHDLREQHIDRDYQERDEEQPGDDLAPVLEERLEAADLHLLFGDAPLEIVIVTGGIVELELLELALLHRVAAVVRRHQPACGSSRCTAAAIVRIAGAARGATRQMPSASASPAARSTT
jgi:hypothetical protein